MLPMFTFIEIKLFSSLADEYFPDVQLSRLSISGRTLKKIKEEIDG